MKILLLSCFSAAVLSVSAGFTSFTYRGGIGDGNGNDLANSKVAVTIRLYAGEADRTALWSGVTNILTEANGAFQIDVSDALPVASGESRAKPLAALLQSGEATRVGITLGNDPETYPRQPFITFPVVRESAVSLGFDPVSTAVRSTRIQSAVVSDVLIVTNLVSDGSILTTNAVLNRYSFGMFDVHQAARVTAFSRSRDCPYVCSGIKFESQGFRSLHAIFPPDRYPKVTRGGMLTLWSSGGNAAFKCVTFPVAADENFAIPSTVGADGQSYQCQFMPFADMDE